MTTWESLVASWRIHGRSPEFSRKVELAKDVCRAAIEDVGRASPYSGGLYCGCSGGKDSVAMTGLLYEAGFRLPVAYCHTGMDTPGSEDTVQELSDHIEEPIEVVEAEADVWEWIAGLPMSFDLLGGDYRAFLHVFSAVNLSIAYGYETNRSGVFLGMRTEESRGRRLNRMFRGKLYQNSVDKRWTCQPIVDWTAKDVFAFAVSRELPIHPYYRLALEKMEVHPESPQSRVGCMLPEDGVVSWKVLQPMSMLYPEMYRHLVSIRPELRSDR